MDGTPLPSNEAPSLSESLAALADSIRDAGESLLDLQEALAELRMVTEPQLAERIEDQVSGVLRRAMRGQ